MNTHISHQQDYKIMQFQSPISIEIIPYILMYDWTQMAKPQVNWRMILQISCEYYLNMFLDYHFTENISRC